MPQGQIPVTQYESLHSLKYSWGCSEWRTCHRTARLSLGWGKSIEIAKEIATQTKKLLSVFFKVMSLFFNFYFILFWLVSSDLRFGGENQKKKEKIKSKSNSKMGRERLQQAFGKRLQKLISKTLFEILELLCLKRLA